MLKELLYWIVGWITKAHTYILGLNDAFEYNFTDKELHFLIIGILGMGFIFAIYPVFRWLANRDHIMTITFIYAFTLIIVITFAIEIGQKVTNSGNMEFADIMMGVLGFVLMYVIFATVRQICKMIYRLITGKSKTGKRGRREAHEEYDDFETYEDLEADEEFECRRKDNLASGTEVEDFTELEKLIELEALDDEE